MREQTGREIYICWKALKRTRRDTESGAMKQIFMKGFAKAEGGPLRLKIAEYPYFIFIEAAERNVRSTVFVSDLRPILG